MIDNSLKKLIINARDGDNEAFDTLVYKIKDDLFRIAKSRLLDENDSIIYSESASNGEHVINVIEGTVKLQFIPYNAWGSLDELIEISF